MGQARKLPQSIASRKAALDNALSKKNNPGPAGNFLSEATTTRLDTAQAAYAAGFASLTGARYQLHSATPTKAAAFAEAQTYCRHFIMVFNLGITRGKYTAAQRSFFGIDVNNDTAPTVNSESDLIQMCQQIISGDHDRTTAGGAAMANPTTAELTTKYNTFKTLHDAYSNLKDGLDIQQESMEAQITEVDNTIKKVWDEVETFYNEEDIESKRANAREWGVVYIHTGGAKTVVINLSMADGTALPPDTQVMLQDEIATPNESGEAIYNTEMYGELTLQVSGEGILPHNSIINVLELGNQSFEVVLQRVE